MLRWRPGEATSSMGSTRGRLRRRQYHVAVFAGDRARDLIGIFTAIANDDGDAFQQAWEYIRDQWTLDPARLQYHAVAGPVVRPRRMRGV